MWKQLLLHFQRHRQKMKVLLFDNMVVYYRVWKNAFSVTWQDIVFSETCYFYIKAALALCLSGLPLRARYGLKVLHLRLNSALQSTCLWKFRPLLSCLFAKCTKGRKNKLPPCPVMLVGSHSRMVTFWEKAVLNLALNLPSFSTAHHCIKSSSVIS